MLSQKFYSPFLLSSSVKIIFTGYLGLLFVFFMVSKEASLSLFRTLLFLTPLVFIYWGRIDREMKVYASILFLFLINLMISNYLSPYTNGFSHTESMFHWLLILPFALVFFNTSLPIKKMFWFINLALLAGLVVAFYDLYTGERRSNGVHGQAIIWGNTAILFGIMSFLFSFSFPQKKYLYIGLFFLGVGVFINTVSQTRSGILVILILSPYLAYRISKRVGVFKSICTFLLLSFFLGFIVSNKNIGMQQRIEHGIDNVAGYFKSPEKYKDSSMGMRFEMWQSGIRGFYERPILGLGFKHGFYNWINQDVEYKPISKRFKHPHNDYITLFAVYGFLAALVFISALIYLCFQCHKKSKTIGESLLVLLLVYALFGLTDSFMFSQVGSAIFIIFSTYFLALANHCERDE